MKPLLTLKLKHKTSHAAAVAYGVNPVQFARLLSKGAYYNDEGEVFIPSQTKLTFKGE